MVLITDIEKVEKRPKRTVFQNGLSKIVGFWGAKSRLNSQFFRVK